MLCHPQSGSNWFRACAQGDIQLVERLKMRKRGSYDNRPSSGNGSVFKGFTGLHYAAYFDRLDVVECLLDLEYNYLTQCTVLIYPYTNPATMEINTTSNSQSKAAMYVGYQQTKKGRKKNPQALSQQSSISHTEIFNTNMNTQALHTYNTSLLYSMNRVCSDIFDHASLSPIVKTNSSNNNNQNAQPFSLDKGSSALMIAIARRNFKVAKIIIHWLKNWKTDAKRLNSMLKLQNAGSMSALMILSTMRASAAAAAILQTGDTMLLRHEFVLLSKEGKSCLHYCIDSGSYMILETIFWVMCDKHADTEDGYTLLYRLAQVLLYDISLPRQETHQGRQSQLSQGNAFATRDEASSTNSSLEEQPSDDSVIDLSNMHDICYSSIKESASNHQRTSTIVKCIKQQTLLDYILYQTNTLTAELRSRIYALVYYYSKKVYLWAEYCYMTACKKYATLTPDISFLKHVKRWADFESRYPKPEIPYSPANKSDISDFYSPLLSARQSINELQTCQSPPLESHSTIQSYNGLNNHRRCISLVNLAINSQPPINANDDRASVDILQLKDNIIRTTSRHSPLVQLIKHSSPQHNSVTFISSNDITNTSELNSEEIGLRKRKNSVQHLLKDSGLTKEEGEGSSNTDDNAHDLSSSNTSTTYTDIEKFNGMSTAKHILFIENEHTDDSVPRASPIAYKMSEDSSDKDDSLSIQTPTTKFTDSPVIEPSSARSVQNQGSIQHNAFRQPREPLDSTSADSRRINDSFTSNSCMHSPSTSASDFNASCRSIVQLNNSLSIEQESDNYGGSVINIPQISSSE